MERLTELKDGFVYMKCDAELCDKQCGACYQLDIIVNRLAYYEDMEEQGRLHITPCKVWDTVYQLRDKNHARGVGISPRIVSSVCVWSNGEYSLNHTGMKCCHSKDLGKTWFLTREEAENALKGGAET